MSAKIIIASDPMLRLDNLKSTLSQVGLDLSHPDVLFLDENQKLGVEAVKKIREHLSFKPYQKEYRGVVVLDAHKLTSDAQNALLKTLEEPPASSVILLGAETVHNFLSTVLSRCEVINLEFGIWNAESKEYYADIEALIQLKIEERFALVEKIEDKEGFIKALVRYFYNQPDKNPVFLKNLLESEKYLSANGNPRAILEYLMLNLPR